MPKLLFLVTEDWYFYSHRLHLARAARQSGYSVIVATLGSLILTPIGKFLRKSSLDELPQLLSILKGDMSFVGQTQS
jgi:lipopolysaccharide/colanic/teichoic acid biosynthesis glycosyltransferase